MPHGKLDVYVEGALQIKDTSILGKGSPYCTLTTGNQEFSSPPVAEGGTLPYFNKHFEFQIDRSTEQLEVKIFSKKTLTDDELLGYCIILFKEVFYHGHVVPVTPFALTRPSGRPGGHIRLSLSFKSQPRRMALGEGYLPPQPVAGPYLQPRPAGSGQGAPPNRQPRSPPQQQQHPAQNLTPGPSAYPPPHDLPRRVNEHFSSSGDSESQSDNDGLKGPAAGEYDHRWQPPPSGRRPGPPPPPRPQPRSQPISRGAAPPPPNNNPLRNFGGAFLQNLGGALVGSAVGSLLNSDCDGSNWGDGGADESYGLDKSYGHDGHDESYGHNGNDESYGHDKSYGYDESYGHNEAYGHDGYDESYGHDKSYGHGVHDESYGHDEMASTGSAPLDERGNEDNGSGVQFEFAEAYEAEEKEANGNGASAQGFVGGSAGPPAAPVVAARGRGRAGPPGRGRAGRAAPPAGRAGMRGRGGRGGRGPPMARGAPLHMARGGPPVMRGRAAPV